MMPAQRYKRLLQTLLIGFFGWAVPGGGHLLLGEKKRAIIIFVTVVLIFLTGLYVGSIAVIDRSDATPLYVYLSEVTASPAVPILAHIKTKGGYTAYGKPGEIGQIYAMTAGLLNLLAIVNAAYLAYVRETAKLGEH